MAKRKSKNSPKKLKYTSAQRSKAAKLHWKKRQAAKKVVTEAENLNSDLKVLEKKHEKTSDSATIWAPIAPPKITLKEKRDRIFESLALCSSEIMRDLNDGQPMALASLTQELHLLTNRIANVCLGYGTNH